MNPVSFTAYVTYKNELNKTTTDTIVRTNIHDIEEHINLRYKDTNRGSRAQYLAAITAATKSIAQDIETYLENNPGEFYINNQQSILFTPTFGEKLARFTVVGFHEVDIPTIQQASEITVDAPYTDPAQDYDGEPGKYVSGYIGSQNLFKNQNIDPRIVTEMRNLKASLEASSPWFKDDSNNSLIYRIDYYGIVFGCGGHSF